MGSSHNFDHFASLALFKWWASSVAEQSFNSQLLLSYRPCGCFGIVSDTKSSSEKSNLLNKTCSTICKNVVSNHKQCHASVKLFMAEAAGGPRYPVTTNVQTTYLVAINFDDHVITFIPCQTDLSTWELKPSQYLQKLSSSRFLVCQAWEPNVPKWKKIALTFIAFNSEILAYAEKFGDFWQHSYTSIRQSLNSWLCSGFVTDWTHCLCKTIAYTEKSASSTFSHAVQDCNSIREHRTTQQLCGLSSACGLLTPSSVHFSGVNWLRSDHTSSNWGLFYCFHRAIFTQVLNSVLFPSSEYMIIRKEHLSVEVCLQEPLAYWVAVQLYYDWHWETKKIDKQRRLYLHLLLLFWDSPGL